MGPRIRPKEPADWRRPRVPPYSVSLTSSEARAERVGLARELPRGIRVLARRMVGSERARPTLVKPRLRRGMLKMRICFS